MEVTVHQTGVHLHMLNQTKSRLLWKHNSRSCDRSNCARTVENTQRKSGRRTNMSNRAITSSVLTKLSISGCIWRSIYNRRRGSIVIGPNGTVAGLALAGHRVVKWDGPGLKYRSLATPTFWKSPSVLGASPGLMLCPVPACALRFARLASASRPSGLRELSGSECNLGEPGCANFTGSCCCCCWCEC